MSDSYRGANEPGAIRPVARVNENILDLHDNIADLYRLTGIEAIQPSLPMVVDFVTLSGAAITAGGTTRDQTLQTPLELNLNEIGHFRCHLLDDVHLIVYQPRQTGRFGTKRAQSRLQLTSRLRDPCGHLSDLFVYKDEYPFVDIINPGGSDLLVARAIFWGFRYRVELIRQYSLSEVKSITMPYTAVLGQGLVRGGGEN